MELSGALSPSELTPSVLGSPGADTAAGTPTPRDTAFAVPPAGEGTPGSLQTLPTTPEPPSPAPASASGGAVTRAGRPSALSLLLAQVREESPASASPSTPSRSTASAHTTPAPTPTAERPLLSPVHEASPEWPARSIDFTTAPAPAPAQSPPPAARGRSETSPLLADPESGVPHPSYTFAAPPKQAAPAWRRALARARGACSGESVRGGARQAVQALPAVVLGSLLNILDGVSYGMIIFPAAGVFADAGLGPVGVSMFFVSALVAQLVYSAGGSGFAGANGSMMIEVVPFFHIIANHIADAIGPERASEVITTTLVAFALSSVLTGIAFFLLGALRLGALIGFFPRHILVGCIGGVGVFLLITGITVSTRMDDDEFALSLATLRFLAQARAAALWAPPLALAVLVRVVTHRWAHQLVFPAYFLAIPLVFYAVVLAGGFDLAALRQAGWLFDTGPSEAWWKFYTYFDLQAVHWRVIWQTMPTQLALLFFNILHPPLNVPALAVSLGQEVDTNKELVAHGYSNLFAGLAGTVPNYLVYVNTLLFYRVGGTTRVAGFMLAGATAVLLFVGTGPIAYIPVMVVGALIFVLGIDLVKEALWDCRHRVSRSEYITIASIMIVMTGWDFVMGVLFGIVVSCVFFVVQNSQLRSVRVLHTGESVMSTVRRPSAHREYLRDVSKQTTVLRLQGFLFFGTIANVEDTIRALVAPAAWARHPLRFLVLDLALVPGVDMSAAEALMRVHRVLAARAVGVCVAGVQPDGGVSRALESVGLYAAPGVEVFGSVNEALEWTENAYLRSWFMAQKSEASEPIVLPGREATDFGLHHQTSVAATPRWSHINEAGWRTIAQDTPATPDPNVPTEPFATLQRAFSSQGPLDRDLFAPLLARLERLAVPAGHVLFQQGAAPADGLYVVQAGVLRARYAFADFTRAIEESMVPGTLAGELSALTGEPRNSTVVAERDAVLWRLTRAGMDELEESAPEVARRFTKMVLRNAKIDYDILLSALATQQ